MTAALVVLEQFGPADDVIVGFRFDQTVLDVIHTIPRNARRFDERAKVWRINPGYADRLAAVLARLGFDVRRIEKAAAR